MLIYKVLQAKFGMFIDNKVLEISFMADEFCKLFDAMVAKHTVPNPKKLNCYRESTMSMAEVMLIIILFHKSGYRCLRRFYLDSSVLIEKLPHERKAMPVANIVVRQLFPYRKSLHAITTDNASGFAAHQEITNRLSLKGKEPVIVYFADSYFSWQKGAIENANKFIRKYIPKNNFDDFPDRTIKQIQKK